MNDSSWFHTNPKKALCVTVLVLFIACDLLTGVFFISVPEGESHAYYHHTLKRNYRGKPLWGGKPYPLYTNSLGFKDSETRNVAVRDTRRRIVVIGDSFTEGIGYPYQKTFVGLVAAECGPSVDILNAGVKSYSPRLYYLKMKYLLEKTGLRCNELYVFLDVSDVQDEIVYESFAPVLPETQRIGLFTRTDSFLNPVSFTYNRLAGKALRGLYAYLFAGGSGSPSGSGEREAAAGAVDMTAFHQNYYEERPRWTSDGDVYNAWGRRGLALAENNMKRLVALCARNGIRVTIAVYPWPFHIRNAELHSLQVRFWQAFAHTYSTGFMNYFPDFIDGRDPDRVIGTCFIPGDVHWSEEGHRIIADRLYRRISGSWSSF